MASILYPLGCSPVLVGWLAVVFIVSAMIGSALLGYIVDLTQTYRNSKNLYLLQNPPQLNRRSVILHPQRQQKRVRDRYHPLKMITLQSMLS